MSHLGQVAAVIDQVTNQLGRTDIPINNAAHPAPLRPSASVDLDDWASALALTVTAAAALTFALLAAQLENRWGRVVKFPRASPHARE